jgi:16S rRNA (uracil1498-N3)-methyltransferase
VKQFILKSEPDRHGTVRLEGDDYRYLVRVRRLATGECFPALLPSGEKTLIKIISVSNNILTGKIHEEITQRHKDTKSTKNNKEKKKEEKTDAISFFSPSSSFASSVPSFLKLPCERLGVNSSVNLPPIILFQAMPKGDKMDLIVRQAAEGGITEVVPFVSEFSVAKTKSSGQKFSRWERIIKEARQQSGSKIATSVRRPLTKDELFDYWDGLKEGALGLLFHHEGLAQEGLHGYLNNIPSLVALAVGPEGGFSGPEVSLFVEKGFKPLTIGDTVLRTETAALYCAAAVRILLLERESWELKQAKNP